MTLLLISFFAFQYLNAQDTLIVYFKDKGNSDFIELSDRAIKRRKKNNVEFDNRDKQVNQDYVNLMRTEGTIMNLSRWLNGLTLITNLTSDELLFKYNFIRDIKISRSISPVKGLNKLAIGDESKLANYGAAQDQIEQIDLDCLHDLGFNGNGIFVAIIDAGYRGMDTISYFDSAFVENRIIDTYDFIGGTPDVFYSSSHGTAVSSCIIAERTGTDPISATAVEVDVALYLSENANSETIIEEFDLVLALERSDSVGADIATISLGYLFFDDPSENHSFSDLDGKTTIAAIGVNTAASKGILVTVSAGNSGPNPISTPCDADSCLCIGAIDENGWYADFSSVGPSADGQVKPDVVARGKDAALVIDNGNITLGNGTSFSAPIMAGAMACLMQANPQSTIEELKLAIRQSGNAYNNPNNFTGYGVPNMCEANDTLYALSVVGIESNTIEELSVYPNPSKGIITVSGIQSSDYQPTFELINVLGERVEILKTQNMKNDYLLDIQSLSSGIYILKVSQGKQKVFTERIIKY